MSEENICSYFGCTYPIAESEKETTKGMKFCEIHLAEIEKLLDSFDARGVVSFWVKAQGGAKRATKRTLGIEVEDE